MVFTTSQPRLIKGPAQHLPGKLVSSTIHLDQLFSHQRGHNSFLSFKEHYLTKLTMEANWSCAKLLIIFTIHTLVSSLVTSLPFLYCSITYVEEMIRVDKINLVIVWQYLVRDVCLVIILWLNWMFSQTEDRYEITNI